MIFESTGVCHQSVETGLAGHGASFARVSPRQARRFCEGAAQLAKADRVDAAMLAETGALPGLKPDRPGTETLHDLKQLTTDRQALTKDRAAARARLAAPTHRLLARQIKRRLRQIERDLCQAADEIDAIVEAGRELRTHADILTSIPGIASACAILADMPEPGDPSGRQAAKLAGLAPIAIGKLAGQRPHPGWARRRRAGNLSTCRRGDMLLPRHEGKI